MSKNHWETQPRNENGKFSFRNQSRGKISLFPKILEKMRIQEVKKTTRGGSYGFLRKLIAGNKRYEIHHMPSASSSPLSRWEGPCIIMSKEDHKKTSSYKNVTGANKYRQWQAKLISEGKFMQAELMDITNIHRKFGDKYDKAITEKLDYDEELKERGKINE
jgi:hypothetical protein